MPLEPSPFLFVPTKGVLSRLNPGPRCNSDSRSSKVGEAIGSFIGRKDYPYVPAQQAFLKGEYLVGIYNDFGSGSSLTLNDLLYFREKQKQSTSLFMSFFAVYLSPSPPDETVFEERMWQELSNLSDKDDAPWDPTFSSDPDDKRFCFSLGGDAFFTVGMHPASSRKARRFSYPAIVFNLFDQFEELDRRGRYDRTVAVNRKRDVQFQGSLNPMVEKYADVWESIQFSGKENPPDWKCPFNSRHEKTT